MCTYFEIAEMYIKTGMFFLNLIGNPVVYTDNDARETANIDKLFEANHGLLAPTGKEFCHILDQCWRYKLFL